MNIVFATSDLYSKPAHITLKSMLVNNRDVEEINVYYVENGLTDESKKRLQKLIDQYYRTIVFIPMPEWLNSISGLLRTNAIAYTYCYFQDILPHTVDKVLLLEGDTIVTDNLTEFYDIDISDYYLAATDDLQSKWCKEKVGIKATSPYFNSGVMLINLKKMREDNITPKITEIIKSGKAKFLYEVQDEMNVMLEGHVKIIPPRFNCTTSVFLFDYKNMKRYRRPTTCCSKEEFDEAKRHPVVVHFTKNQIIQSRPWIEECTHPYKKYYLQVKAKTVLADEPLWKSDRNKTNRFVNFVYSKISKTIVASTLGIVHAFLYPVVLYKYILTKKA